MRQRITVYEDADGNRVCCRTLECARTWRVTNEDAEGVPTVKPGCGRSSTVGLTVELQTLPMARLTERVQHDGDRRQCQWLEPSSRSVPIRRRRIAFESNELQDAEASVRQFFCGCCPQPQQIVSAIKRFSGFPSTASLSPKGQGRTQRLHGVYEDNDAAGGLAQVPPY